MCPSEIKEWTDIAAHVFSSCAILAAAWWFLYTTQFKPRVQFDVECRFFPLQFSKTYVAEVSFVFENKGFVEHRLYDLSVSIHGLRGDLSSSVLVQDKRLFDVRLLPKQVIVPPKYRWYFVRPGVRQVITHHAVLDDPGALVQVTAGFSYEEKSEWPHTARRVFAVAPASSTVNPTRQ